MLSQNQDRARLLHHTIEQLLLAVTAGFLLPLWIMQFVEVLLQVRQDISHYASELMISGNKWKVIEKINGIS